MSIVFSIACMLFAYVKRFSSEFDKEDRDKVLVFCFFLILLYIIIVILTNR